MNSGNVPVQANSTRKLCTVDNSPRQNIIKTTGNYQISSNSDLRSDVKAVQNMMTIA